MPCARNDTVPTWAAKSTLILENEVRIMCSYFNLGSSRTPMPVCVSRSFIQLLQVMPLDAPSIALLQTNMDRCSHRHYITGLGGSVYAYPEISGFRCPAVSDSFDQVGQIREEEYVSSIIGVRIGTLYNKSAVWSWSLINLWLTGAQSKIAPIT